jgi:MoaA/NifB/PqqE/SkfB family radical SAM enzyme
MIIAGHPFPEGPNPVLKLWANAKALGEAEIRPARNAYLFPIRAGRDSLQLLFRLDRVFEDPLAADRRELGICVYKIAVRSLESPPPPATMELETTTICDINPPCVMCYPRMLHTREGKESRNLDETAWEKIAPHLRDFEVISLHGIGEPLAGKNLFPILRSIDSRKTKVQFNSNGLNLSEEKSRELVKRGLSLINFSVDAATPETYRKIRRADFGRVRANIRRFAEIKKESSARHPVLEMNMTLMRSNFEEAGQFVRLAKDLGAERVSLGVLNRHFEDYMVRNGDFVFSYQAEIIGPESAAFRAKIQEAREAARALGIDLSLLFSGA